MRDVYNMLLEAINKKELIQFLEGKGEYKLSTPYMSPTEQPTDWGRILEEGIYLYYNKYKDEDFIRNIESKLMNMTDDIEGLYSAVNILFYQIINEQLGESPFIMDKEKIIGVIRNKINRSKNDLKEDKRWMGETEENGLYDEIKRINMILMERYGIRIIS